MKKSTKIIIAVVAILLVLIVIGAILTAVGVLKFANKTKPSITSEEFISKLEEKSFLVADTKSTQFASYDYITKAYVALSEDYSYKIEFYELTSDEYAASFYASNKTLLENGAGNMTANTEFSGKNFSRFTLMANGDYSIVSRINNTVVYVNSADSNKDAINSVVEGLGY